LEFLLRLMFGGVRFAGWSSSKVHTTQIIKSKMVAVGEPQVKECVR